MMPDPVVFTSVPKNWLEFFKMGGFSKETSESYSALFQEHAVEMEQMSDITAQVLRDMGLRVGPIMRVQRAIAAYLDFTKAKLAK